MNRIYILPIERSFKDLNRLYQINDEAFPVDERIPSYQLFDIMAQYGCQPFAIYNDDEMVGFTAVVSDKDLQIGYIWYFAIAIECRNKGIGSAALQELQNIFKGYQLVLDMEQVIPTAANYDQRQQRLAFYKRNGFDRPMVGMSYLGMDFELMCSNPPLRLDDFKALVAKIQNDYWHPVFYMLEFESCREKMNS